jgi:hypothetical protein
VSAQWAHGTGADTATNTLTGTTCNLVFTQASVANTVFADHTGSTFNTCAIDNGANAAKTDYAFCVIMQAAGVAYNGNATNYELMVPVTNTSAFGSEPYYFYVELD